MFKWRQVMKEAGLQRNASYLVRPDGYVGLAGTWKDVADVASYPDERGLGTAK